MKKIKAVILGFAGTMVISWVGNYFYDSTKNIPVLKYVIIFLRWVYNTIIGALTFPVKVWWVLLAAVIAYSLYKLFSNTQDDSPDFINYRQDVFKSWIWRWDWRLTANGWAITNLIPFCPIDDVQLIDNSDYLHSRAYCPKCNRRFGEYENPLEYTADTKVLINDKINKNSYPKTP